MIRPGTSQPQRNITCVPPLDINYIMSGHNVRLSAKECFSVKFSRTEKMKKSFTRIGVSIWNSIPLSVKTLNISNFRKKIKSLFLHVLDNENNYS